LIGHQRFVDGHLTTAFIDEEYPDGFGGAPREGVVLDALLAAGVLTHHRRVRHEGTINGQLHHYQPTLGVEWVINLDDASYQVAVSDVEGGFNVSLAERLIEVRSDWRPGQRLFRGTVNGRDVIIQTDPVTGGYHMCHRGIEATSTVRTFREAELAALMPVKLLPDTSKYLLCPMPGLVVSVDVEEGDEDKAGQALAVVEAMKMENILRAERDGIVSVLRAVPGDSLAVDEIILEFE